MEVYVCCSVWIPKSGQYAVESYCSATMIDEIERILLGLGARMRSLFILKIMHRDVLELFFSHYYNYMESESSAIAKTKNNNETAVIISTVYYTINYN